MPGAVENALHEAVEAPLGSRRSRRPSTVSKTCTLTFHDEVFCRQSVLTNPELFAPHATERTVLQIVSPEHHKPANAPSRRGSQRATTTTAKHVSSPHFVFTLEPASTDVLAGYPGLEVSLLKPIATALGFTNRSQVVVSEVDGDEHLASHVEIAFKDAYLTRADMWRLLTSDLVGTSIYRNQKVLFVNSVRAHVKAIYAKGRRVQSALLDASTKAIFRSDSSRYYILLQMSREMWDFDAEGSGEIMFHKVINGFLPELFRRWEALGTTHSVSVILFTRMEYDNHPSGLESQDYYRVLTTELLSSESAEILQRLKEEFKTFLRDVSVSRGSKLASEGAEEGGVDEDMHGKISGRPANAIYGNILEAIHTASLQFLRSNATCDLRRTGLSIIVISPGVGMFEVDRHLLAKTTDVLIDNGIYIDLVCLAKMPLHSSPLFRYRISGGSKRLAGVRDLEELKAEESGWEYTIPHWVDVSFWQGLPGSDIEVLAGTRGEKRMRKKNNFVPRIRMYEIQMTGLMQYEFSIAIPQLICPHSVRFPTSFGFNHKLYRPRASVDAHDLEGSKAVYNQGFKESTSATSPEKLLSHQQIQPLADLMSWMDDYDEAAFKPPRQEHDDVTALGITKPVTALPATPQRVLSEQIFPGQGGDGMVEPLEPSLTVVKRKSSTASTTSKVRVASSRFNPLSRQFGPGFRGFGTAKAAATTHISAEPIASLGAEPSLASRASSAMEHSFPTSSAVTRPSTRASSIISHDASEHEMPDSPRQKSKPINIRPLPNKRSVTSVSDARDLILTDPDEPLLGGRPPTRKERASSSTAKSQMESESPWITMSNPSNPKKLGADMTSRLGRWQHVFPKPTSASTIKWKSLCSPACLPLTTEEFPSPAQLKTEYGRTEYEVKVPKEKEINENEDFGEWLIRELVASRLTRGFSVVVGNRPADALDLPKAQWYEFLHEKGMSRSGVKIVMSRGNEIHELLNVKKGVVRIGRYVRNKTEGSAGDHINDYYPLIRTAYAGGYVKRHFSFLSKSQDIDWERLDRFIALDEEELNEPYPENLQYWQARFVLIPIAVSGSRKRNHSPEDNEEEIRLEGIRKLTQMWQKNRYLPPNERKYESKTRKDLNPLDIVYQTRSASAIVSELNDTILADAAERKPAQLLPEKELFERAKFSTNTLAKALQGEKGVRLLDRRWHWRLHYHCFIGLELVTWLANNFRDIDTREEAVEFGNQLMADGLFVHVEKRHNFRDGNFFYQITEKYRAPRQDHRTSWFGRLSDRSVPPTPITDRQGDDAKILGTVSEGTGEEEGKDGDQQNENTDGATTATARPPKSSVTLSKQLVYDMDHRKKSYRRELVNLHIDRISSADDCYHIRIDWVTATPKLIEDTVEGWATTAERSGLRLVEVPLLEAWRFTDSHPFRHPYYIRLVKKPPVQQPHAAATDASAQIKSLASVASDSSGAAAAQVASQQTTTSSSSSWPYHKAILKKFDFVLDLEAASDFPDDVEVSYSWGTPEYRLPQYITRSGRLLAQITPDGRFLLLINQLFSERGAAAREAQRTAAGAGSTAAGLHAAAISRANLPEPLDLVQHTARRTPLTPAPASSAGMSKLSHSPFASPMLRAAANASEGGPYATTPLPQAIAGIASNPGPSSASSLASPMAHQPVKALAPQPPLSKSELLSIKQLRIELEEFCSDAAALERFYEEELHRPLATVPATPIVRPMSMYGIEEVASGAVPPALSLRDEGQP